MGTTMEFYSADPQQLTALFEGGVKNGAEFFQQLHAYPMADFSLHLVLPDDLDSLCQSLNRHSQMVPRTFRDLLVRQLWRDGRAESLTLLSDRFAFALATMGQSEIEQAALDWSATFLYDEPPEDTPAYRAMHALREVAGDAATQKRSLILHLLG